MTNIIDELKWRGAVNQVSDEENLSKLLDEKSVGVYCGTDPTGDSLHVGHLIPFMMLKRFQLAGHRAFILIGGGTGSIGDPSGRSTERTLQTMEQVHHNEEALTSQMKKLFGEDNITIVNNYDWLSKISLLDFLRDYGKLFNINTMLNKEVVASRLEVGISFTEFTYQILQAVDFHHLLLENDVQLQIGGADQWGNITAGIDLIHKMEGSDTQAFALTIPLMLKADGTKFGKSAGGAVWLDPEKTTPYEFYQFWLNQDDRDVVKYLKYFTFLGKEEIEELAKKVETEPEKREAQRRLAEEVTEFVHGKEAVHHFVEVVIIVSDVAHRNHSFTMVFVYGSINSVRSNTAYMGIEFLAEFISHEFYHLIFDTVTFCILCNLFHFRAMLTEFFVMFLVGTSAAICVLSKQAMNHRIRITADR